jgi:non-specific protein-tyrosine kinase
MNTSTVNRQLPTSSETAYQDDLREYLRVVRSRKWTIVVTTAIVLAATAAFTLHQTPIYRATAEVLVQPVQNPLNLYMPPTIPDMNTEQQVATSQAVADEVLKTTPIAIPVPVMAKNLDVAVVPDTDVLEVSYSSPSPSTAAKMANAFANAYISFRTNQAVDRLKVAADTVKRQIDGVKGQLSDVNRQIANTNDSSVVSALSSQRESLISRLGTLQDQYAAVQPGAAAVQGSGVVVQKATPPTSPASPNKIRNGALGLLAGLALGIGLAFLRERFDDRIRGREEVERVLTAPVLAIVPKVATWKREEDSRLVMVGDPKSPVAESYRTLATNLLYAASRHDLELLLVTSGTSAEGKTTTTANLGVALAQTGKRVIVVSADMRKPRLHRFFGLTNEVGLADFLSGRAPLDAAAQETPIAGLRVMPGGPVPHNPAGLLAGPRAAAAFDELRASADFVILDAPPALAVADASIIAPQADGTLYLMDATKASRSSLSQARRQLENAGADLLGAVINNFDATKAANYQYSYYSSYYEYREDDDKGRNGGSRHRPSLDLRRSSGEGTAVGFEQDTRPISTNGDGNETAAVPAGGNGHAAAANGNGNGHVANGNGHGHPEHRAAAPVPRPPAPVAQPASPRASLAPPQAVGPVPTAPHATAPATPPAAPAPMAGAPQSAPVTAAAPVATPPAARPATSASTHGNADLHAPLQHTPAPVDHQSNNEGGPWWAPQST